MKPVVRAFLLLVGAGVLVGAMVAYAVVSRGLSNRVPPTAVEERLALTLRHLATPQAVRERRNPVEPGQAVIDEGLEHFADHCATCHANNGSGDTEMGRGLYPRAPDMRAARTQALSDGELFAIIENGIRLSGMPAWGDGTPDSAQATWKLVRFIRHLPSITVAEVSRMEALNPRSPEEFREEEAQRRFLAGEDQPAGEPAPPGSGGRHR